uniref:C11orf51 homolog n=1 Tax=Lepeophtheirus salmonis TaxID=72036 RepID=C1BVR5_LEPSM|nr:C11orf51 homolog [Lepeophtheirus salmonis]
MSYYSYKPFFPSLLPRLTDPLWHRVDAPKDEEAELSRLENERAQWIKGISERYGEMAPIGKTNSQEPLDDEEEEEEDVDDDNDNDHDDNGDSDSHEEDDDDDIEMDLNLALESPST